MATRGRQNCRLKDDNFPRGISNARAPLTQAGAGDRLSGHELMTCHSGYAGPHVAFVLVGWFIHASSRAASFVRAAVCACTAIIVLCHVFMGAMCVSPTVSAAVYAHRETYPQFRIQQLQMQGCNQLIHICAMWDVRFLLVTAGRPLPRGRHSHSTEHAAIRTRALPRPKQRPWSSSLWRSLRPWRPSWP